MNRYDVVVIGAGPAGLSAALNVAIRRRSVLVVGPVMSEKLKRAARIDNYPGMPGCTGEAMLMRFREQVEQLPVDFLTEQIRTVYDMGEYIGILRENGEILEAGAVILATGVSFGHPIPGEAHFLGRGVSTCATCDAALYRGRSVVVVGYNEYSLDEARFISEAASETVFINRTGRPAELGDRIRVIEDKPLSVEGDETAERLRFKDFELEADGFFFIRDAVSSDALVPGLELASDGIHVAVRADMSTNLQGIYACGDVTGKPYQIAIAVGQGQTAGLAAADFVARGRLKHGRD